MGVCGRINTGALWDCDNKSTGGIEQGEIILINRESIDFENTIIERDSENGKHRVSLLTLKENTKAFSFEGINGKKILHAGYKPQTSDFFDAFSHSVNVAIYDQEEASLITINQFVNGAEVVAIIENKSKNNSGKSAFQIYGLDRGLKVGDFNYDSNENN